MPPTGAPWAPQGLLLAHPRRTRHSVRTMVRRRQHGDRVLPTSTLASCMHVHRSTVHATPLPRTPRTHRAPISASSSASFASSLPPSPADMFRVALLGVVVTRAVVVWHGFGVRVFQERKDEELEEWREDARCVWRVLRGERKRIMRACITLIKPI